MRQGELKSALGAATAAFKAARQSGRPLLLARVMLQLGEAQGRSGNNEAGIDTAQRAAKLFELEDDACGVGRAHWVVALGCNRQSRVKEARAAAETALDLCGRAGDRYGAGNALNSLSQSDTDIAESIRHLQQATQAFEMAGYAERRTVSLGNLAVSYDELGLYHHARRLQREVVEATRDMGAKVGLTYGLGNLLAAELKLGALDAATRVCREFVELASALGDPSMDSALAGYQGDLALAKGDPRAAVRYFQSAVQIARRTGLGVETVFLTQLGHAHLAAGDAAAALKATTKATAKHRDQSFAKPDSLTSQEIWWRHAQALSANRQSAKAREALARAYDFLLEGIANLRDEGLRRNFLNKVPANREIVAAWLRDGAARKLPNERLTAHLAIESNVREPFKRLADTVCG